METMRADMRQLDLFSALQSSTEGIDTEFKSARGGVANTQGDTNVLFHRSSNRGVGEDVFNLGTIAFQQQ
jgi:hypothetical protein